MSLRENIPAQRTGNGLAQLYHLAALGRFVSRSNEGDGMSPALAGDERRSSLPERTDQIHNLEAVTFV